MTDAGFTITLRDVWNEVRGLTAEVHKVGGSMAGFENAVAIGVAQRADHELRLRKLEDERIGQDAIGRWRRQARAGLWAGLAGLGAALAAAAALLSGALPH